MQKKGESDLAFARRTILWWRQGHGSTENCPHCGRRTTLEFTHVCDDTIPGTEYFSSEKDLILFWCPLTGWRGYTQDGTWMQEFTFEEALDAITDPTSNYEEAE